MRKYKLVLAPLLGISMLLSVTVHAEGVLSSSVLEKLPKEGTIVWYHGSGGETTRVRDKTVNAKFEKETGLDLRADYNSNITKFFAAEESGANIPWSLIEFATKSDFIRAVEKGFVEKLNPEIVDTSVLYEGTYSDYGVDVLRYGINFTYNTEVFKNNPPSDIRDIYNLEKYPGKRCLFQYPQFGAVLESALLADGVSPEKLYPLDLDRAFKKLNTIKDNIVWWSSGDDAIRLLATGECSMGVAWSGRVMSAVRNDNLPLKLTYPYSLYSTAVYAVPKGASEPAVGQAMIEAFISDIPSQIELVNQIGYTTGIKSIKSGDYDPSVLDWVPSAENTEKSIEENAEYYSDNLNNILDRFNRWVAE